MRTHKIGNITVEYPDEISFCFNPIVINVLGYPWAWVEAVVRDVTTGIEHVEKRVLFQNTCFFDVSFYTQSYFDSIQFGKIDYTQSGAAETPFGRLFSLDLNMYSEGGELSESFQFETFVVWGAMKIGERYNGDRVLTWFKNFPFTVGMYTAGTNSVNIIADNVSLPSISLQKRGIYNLFLTGIHAQREVVLVLPGSGIGTSVFDMTFDYTFHAVEGVPSHVRLLVDDCAMGVYLRWVNRHGFYCYWLFKAGDEKKQVVNDGEFIRNNMQDYNYVNGYHSGTGRKQRKTEENTLLVCAPLVDSDTYNFLFQLAMSPVVDMYMGKDSDKKDRWQGVNVAVETFNKTRAVLQDFIATIILPETRVQSL